MANDNSPKERQYRQLERKRGQRKSYDRILIVSEGSKTEPKYFNEIRCTYKLATTAVHICHSSLGSDPLNVVKSAEKLLTEGDNKKISPHAFEQVYAVFDRDEHNTYFAAIKEAKSLDNKYFNDNKEQRVKFTAIPSIPSFEIWLLLHFKDVQAPLHRREAFEQVKKYISNYEKSADDIFKLTRGYLAQAYKRAEALAKFNSAANGEEPYTAVNYLVKLLVELKKIVEKI